MLEVLHPQEKVWLSHYNFTIFPQFNSKLSHATPATREEETAKTMVDGSEKQKCMGEIERGKGIREEKGCSGNILQAFISDSGAG